MSAAPINPIGVGVGVGIGIGSGSMPVPSGWQPASSPAVRRMRAYFAPVNRATSTPTYFDPAQASGFDPDNPPAPWIDLGWIEDFARKSASKITAVLAGSPATVQEQVRQELEATVTLRFLSWGKLQLALAAGSDQKNLLVVGNKAVPSPSGGTALPAARTLAGSTSTNLMLDPTTTTAAFQPGCILAVDDDYTKQTGYVGAGASAAYIPSTGLASNDIDYIRRVTLNVGQIASVQGLPPTSVQLQAPLLGGAPAAGVGVQVATGFVDREGGSFFQEWSALFAAPGEQGDWIFYHYPRLQAMQGAAESAAPLAAPLAWVQLQAQFRALPVTDVSDGAQVLCFRSYLPAPNSAI
jgi:hypothetical protein